MCTACSPVRLGGRRVLACAVRWVGSGAVATPGCAGGRGIGGPWDALRTPWGRPEEGRGSAGLARRLQVPCKCLSACAGACVVLSTCWPNSDLVEPEGYTTGERSVRLFALCAGFGTRQF
jgi:hypothetical protein